MKAVLAAMKIKKREATKHPQIEDKVGSSFLEMIFFSGEILSEREADETRVVPKP